MARKYPAILERLADGSLTLTAVRLLGPHLTDDNYERVLGLAKHAKKRALEELVASLAPKPDVATVIRKLPQPSTRPVATAAPTSVEPGAPSRVARPHRRPHQRLTPASVVQPLAPERYKLQLTIAKETHDTLRQLQDLMRHAIPGRRSLAHHRSRAEVTTRGCAAAEVRYDETPPRRYSRVFRLARHSRGSAPRGVGAGRGTMCLRRHARPMHGDARSWNIHHRQPFAAGGQATVENIELRCRAHNPYKRHSCFSAVMVQEPGPGWPDRWAARTRDSSAVRCRESVKASRPRPGTSSRVQLTDLVMEPRRFIPCGAPRQPRHDAGATRRPGRR